VLRAAVDSPRVTRILVHYLDFATQYQDVWSGTDKPLFVHCHGHDCTWDARHEDPAYQRYNPPEYVDQARHLASRAVLIVGSRTAAQRLFDIGISPKNVVIKSLGVPVPAEPPKREPRTKGVTVLYLGRLADCKGPDLVIRAFEIACARGLDGRLVLAGNGPLRTTCELLRARSAFKERISLLGPVGWETGPTLRAEADIFAAHNCFGPLSFMEEAFGVSIVEAMASALPVVSGRSGSLPEIIENGREGLLVEPGDVNAHAEALLRLARDPVLRQRMGEAGWRKAKERFSCERERAQLRAILGLDGAGNDSGPGTSERER